MTSLPTLGATHPGLPRRAAWIAAASERYVLSLIYLGFTYIQWEWVRSEWPDARLGDPVALGNLSADGTMLALNLIMGLVLLLGRPATAPPRTLKDIAVPLAASYFFLMFTYMSWLPPSLSWLRINHAPATWRGVLDGASFAIGTLGTVIATWGILSLGRSFGIFVAVRTVVLRGPYRFVRHPMYAGYIIACVGVALAEASIAVTTLVIIQSALFVWRARLEEARLSEVSPEYRAYQRHTGFVFPRAGRASGC